MEPRFTLLSLSLSIAIIAIIPLLIYYFWTPVHELLHVVAVKIQRGTIVNVKYWPNKKAKVQYANVKSQDIVRGFPYIVSAILFSCLGITSLFTNGWYPFLLTSLMFGPLSDLLSGMMYDKEDKGTDLSMLSKKGRNLVLFTSGFALSIGSSSIILGIIKSILSLF